MIVNEPRPPIEDLDSVPFPSYDGMNIDYYLGYDDENPIRRMLHEPIGSIMSSRGCHYNCIFCATDKILKRFRARTPKNVVDEMEYLIVAYGVKEIAFHDDCFLSSRERVKGICDEILKRKIRIRWAATPGMNVWLLDEELLKIMYKSGLYRITLTVESGSKDTLKFIRKAVNLEKTKEIIKICNRLGLRTGANFIIGFPYESMDDINSTRRYLLSSGLDTVSVLLSQPLKGADLFDIYVKEGLMPKEGPLSGSSIFRTRYGSKYFSADELNRMAAAIKRDFRKRYVRRLLTPEGFYYHFITKLNSPGKFFYILKKIMMRVFG